MTSPSMDAAVGRRRSAARMAAVQALYQLAGDVDTPEEIIRQFTDHRFAAGIEEAPAVEPDRTFFADLVAGVGGRRQEIDPLIASALATGWSVERMERVVHAILRAGVFELMARDDVPARVVINEYVEIAHAFYADGEPGFVNSVLDRLAHQLRAAEFGANAASGG